MATAKPSPARARAKARPIRCAPPVTRAALGIGATGKPPVSSVLGLASSAATALPPRSHFGAGYLARRPTGPPRRRASMRAVRAPRLGRFSRRQPGRKSKIDLLEPADLVPQPCCLLEFEIGGGVAHALFEIRDHCFEIGALVVLRLSLRKPKRHMIALIDALEDVGNPAAHAFRGDPVSRIVSLLFFPAPVGLVDRRFQAVGHPIGVKDGPAVDVASCPSDGLNQRGS